MSARGAVVLLLLAGLVAGCDGAGAAAPDRFAQCWNQPGDCNSGPRRAGGSFVVALAQPPANFNVVSVGGAAGGALTEGYTVMDSLLPGAFAVAPGGVLAQNTDLLVSVALAHSHPQTVVYQISPTANWDDGTPISADDFGYAWRTQNGRDCPACATAGTAGYEQIASVQGTDNGRTVTVTFNTPYPDWRGLFAALYPAHIEGAGLDLSTQDGLRAAFARQDDQPSWTGGPYRISSYQRDRQLVLVPNPHWYGRDKPTLDRLVYRFVPDQARMVAGLQAKEVNAFVGAPSQDLLDVLAGLAGIGAQYQIGPGPVWERVDLNAQKLSAVPLRQAIFAAIDVDEIIKQTVRGYFPGVRRLYSHTMMPGTPGYQEVIKRVAPDQGMGNLDAARQLLTGAGYTEEGGRLTKGGRPVPALRLRYTRGNDNRELTARIVRRQLARLGIEVRLEPTDDLTGTLDRRDYDLAIYGWPASPLLAGARELWASDGGSNHTGWGDPASDALLRQAAQELDQQRMYDELNRQDEILTRNAVVLPLYQKPELLALVGDFVNVRDNPAGYLSYNAQQWGLRG